MASPGWRNVTGCAVDGEIAAARALAPGEDVEQLVLALALKRHHPDDLAGVDLERDVLELGARGEPAGREPRLGVPGTGGGLAPLPGGRQALDDLAQHQLDDPVLGAGGDVHDAHRRALAQDRRPVADRGDLDHAVGDEDDAALAAALAADDLEHALREVRRQGCGHLVEHQDVGLDRQRARQVDDPQRREGEPLGQRAQDGLLHAELVHPVAEGLDPGPGQPQVRPDVEVGDEGRLLVDRHDPAAPGLAGRADGQAPAADGDRAGIGPDGAAEDLDEGALAGAVGAHERMHLTGPDREGRGPQGHHRAVGLGDIGGLEQQVGRRDGHVLLRWIAVGGRRCRPPTIDWLGVYAPLQDAGTVFGS